VVLEEQVVQQPLLKLAQAVNQGLMAKEAAQVVAVLFSWLATL
jgi:hypothetical protein